MRILFASDVIPDPNSGAAGTEYQTIAALRCLGHEVDEIWGDSLSHRIKHMNLHYLLELPKTYEKAIEKRCRNKCYDAIHVNQPYAYLAAKEHRRRKRPGVFVNRSHGFEARAMETLSFWYKKLGMRERIFPRSMLGYFIDKGIRHACKDIAANADGFIVSCSEDKSYLECRYAVQPERVACIPQAVPSLFLERDIKPISAMRLRRLLCIGPAQFYKGPHVIAQTLNEVVRSSPDISFTWVCSSRDRQVAADMFSPDSLARTTFRDPCSQDELIDIYDAHGILLFPSLFEGFGKVFLEAMSRGLCVVASDTGGMRDVISNGRDGILVEIGNWRKIADAVSRILLGEDQAASMSKAARATALNYSWERVGRETVAFYGQLLHMKGNKI